MSKGDNLVNIHLKKTKNYPWKFILKLQNQDISIPHDP